MKKILLFVGGFITGIIVTVLVALSFSVDNQPDNDLSGLTIFSERGECIKTGNEIKVFQVLKPNMALANTGDFSDGIVVLLVNYDGKYYYDDEKIKIPGDKCARQRGIYQYTTKNNQEKTVPVIVIE